MSNPEELKQEFIARYLSEILAVPKEIAQKDAQTMLRCLSTETLDNMVAFFEYVHSCPMVAQTFLQNFSKCCHLSTNSANTNNIPNITMEPILSEPSLPNESTHLTNPKNNEISISTIPKNIPTTLGNCLLSQQAVYKLTDLKPGEKGTILRLMSQGAIRRRLIDMGVLPDVVVELQSVAPLGDPIKIKMKGYYLTLRKSEADGILLKTTDPFHKPLAQQN